MTVPTQPEAACTGAAARPLPPGWRWAVLRNLLVALETGSRPPGGAFGVDGGVPSLSAEHMTRAGTFDLSTLRYVPLDFHAGMARGHIRKNDILIVKDGATTGKVAFVDEHFPFEDAVVNEHVFLCRADRDAVDPRFLFYWLWGSAGQSAIRANFQGAAIGGINQTFASTVVVPLPPLPEQKRIAAILKDQLAAVEGARAATEAQLCAARKLPAATLRCEFLPRVEVWPRRPLGEIAKLLASKSIATAGDADVRAITTACLTETGFDPSGIKPARMWAADAAECVVTPGEVLIARSNTPELVGRAAMYRGNPAGVVASDLTIRIQASDSIRSEFLARYLSCLYVIGYWKDRAGGASGSMKKITRTQIEREPIPVPPLREQDAINVRLNGRIGVVQQTVSLLEQQLNTVNSLPAALLRFAFTGEV